MSMCYYPRVFDAERFATGLAAAGCPATLDIAMLLWESNLDQPDWGSLEGDIEYGRVPANSPTVSLIDHVRLGLSASAAQGHAEAHALLGHVSLYDGRLIDEEPMIGYLLPDEIRRASALLTEIAFADAAQDDDRLLLLRLFAIALESECGVFWWWT